MSRKLMIFIRGAYIVKVNGNESVIGAILTISCRL